MRLVIGCLIAAVACPVAAENTVSIELGGDFAAKSLNNPEWQQISPGVHERMESGKKIQVATGVESLIGDIAELHARVDRESALLKAASSRKERAKIQDSIDELGDAIRALEGALAASKGVVTDYEQLAACFSPIVLEATLSFYPGMIDSFSATITAYGESFVPFAAAQGTVTVLANASGITDSRSKLIYTDYIGESVTASAGEDSWGCDTLSATAYVVPSCGVAGYRRATISASCASLYDQNPVSPGWRFSQWRNR